jgi:hypothetical protein
MSTISTGAGDVAKVVFSVVEGENLGETFEVEKGTCRTIGRAFDKQKTKIFSPDSVMPLDEEAKKLVIKYVAQQFQKSGTPEKTKGEKDVGGFIRGSDFHIRDPGVSRLHAMIFYDHSGAVGIIDLRSRNGTFVNGAEIEFKILKKGDLITIGDTKIRCEAL